MKAHKSIIIFAITLLAFICVPLASAAEVTNKATAKQVKKSSSGFDFAGLLNGLQKKVTLGNVNSNNVPSRTVSGLKQVDTTVNGAVEGEFAVATTADILLDSSGLGEATPSDANPDVR